MSGAGPDGVGAGRVSRLSRRLPARTGRSGNGRSCCDGSGIPNTK
ncbi:hypothetical protein F8B43_0974 [Methylorubrum populi]|uniref:Uncharacterized protein n=1 Tax=Methylorubrum populi TaxID=223967 RepID=A0A833MYR3_9HYPH|nr:hypothetical protein F8B43_0974 [Methylorubrum populi]